MSIIKKKREARNKSVQWLADEMGVGSRTIYRWESYDFEPNIPQLAKLSRVLKVSLNTIIKDYITHYNKEVT